MAKNKRRQQVARPQTPSDAQPELSAEERAARREQQKQEWAAQKQSQERAANRSFAPILAAGGVIVTLAIVIPLVLLVASGGGSGTPTPTPRLDARLGGQAPAATFAMSANDDGQNINPRFEPNNFVAKAGEVFEIDVTNNGSSAHNVTIDGGNGFGSLPDDDWVSSPASFKSGETAKVIAKLDEPGTYNFECNLHAGIQVGTITVIPSASSAATPAPIATTAPSQPVSP